jgi:hypothetical protein
MWYGNVAAIRMGEDVSRALHQIAGGDIPFASLGQEWKRNPCWEHYSAEKRNHVHCANGRPKYTTMRFTREY